MAIFNVKNSLKIETLKIVNGSNFLRNHAWHFVKKNYNYRHLLHFKIVILKFII